MTLKIDRYGRVILPKPVRERLGWREGSDLELEESGAGITLKSARRTQPLVKRNGLLMHTGKLPKGYDWNRLIEDDREIRLHELGAS